MTEFHYIESVSSTMDIAKQWLDSRKTPGFSIQAAVQTAGRGRRDRKWDSPQKGNLYTSYVPALTLTPPYYWSFITAAALHQNIEAHYSDGRELKIKWPNDVHLDGQKCAGILVEIHNDIPVIGFGVNVSHAPDGAASLNKESKAASLSELQALNNQVVGAINDWGNTVLKDGFGPLKTYWEQHAAFMNASISIDKGRFTGVFKGVNDVGAAILELEDGTERIITAGDVMPLYPSSP